MTHSKHSLHRPSRAAAPASLRLERWQRYGVYGTVVLLTLSGLLWIAGHFFLRPVSEFGATISPLEPWSMKVHGASAMAMLFLIGSMLNTHIRRAIRSARNRVSGWSMVALLAFLAGGGYGLYYLVSEDTRPVWSLLHWGFGGIFAVGLVAHILLGRRSGRR